MAKKSNAQSTESSKESSQQNSQENVTTEAPAAKKKRERGGAFRFFYKTFFNVPAWIGFKQIKESNRVIIGAVKDAFMIKEVTRAETFEQATERLNIDEQQLKQLYKSYTRNFYIMLLVVLLLIIYGIYLLSIGGIKGFFVDLAVIVFASVRAMQFGFWRYQIRVRKLNCNLRQWLFNRS